MLTDADIIHALPRMQANGALINPHVCVCVTVSMCVSVSVSVFVYLYVCVFLYTCRDGACGVYGER